MKGKLREAALAYRKFFGWPVIPIYFEDEGNGKLRKKPLVTWKVYQEKAPSVEETGKLFDDPRAQGISLVCGKASGVVSLDLDEYKPNYDPEKIKEALGDLPPAPTFKTPRGGRQLLFKCPAEGIRSVTDLLPGVDVKGDGGLATLPGSENRLGRYEWVPGMGPRDLEPPELPARVVELLSKAALYNNNKSSLYKGLVVSDHGMTTDRPQVTTNDHKLFTEGRRDNDLFHIALTLARGGSPRAEIEETLARLASACSPPFNQREIKAKIDSALKRIDGFERNITAEVGEFIETSQGWFATTELHDRLQLTTRDHKRAAVMALLRYLEKGVIERHPSRNGVYRKRETECEVIDFKSASGKPLDIRWPFGLESLVNTMPKQIVVVAGSPDAGKTAFLLGFARMNQDRHVINYFSSEMGANELRSRLELFNFPLDSWKVIFKERSSNFQDVIRADEVNVIDFLEIHKDFFEVGGLIKDIWDRLGNGIAVIAIQKNPGVELGLGGGRSLEKARLYLSMDNGKIKIVKAKNWADPTKNPNKLCMDFKIVKGCKLLEQSAWTKEI